MSNYTNTFSNANGDTILGSELTTEFQAIVTALATKALASYARDVAGSSITSTIWYRTQQSTLSAGYADEWIDLGTISTVGGDSVTPNCALGNMFYVTVTYNNAVHDITVNAPTNPVSGQEIWFIVARASGGVTPDRVANFPGATFRYSASGGGMTTGMNASTYRLYHALYDGVKWNVVTVANNIGF